MKKHDKKDEVELRLLHDFGYWYDVQWRYKPQVKEIEILPWPICLKIKFKTIEKLNTVMMYKHPNVSISSCTGDPYDLDQWYAKSLNLSESAHRKDWEYYQKRIKTYEDLNFMFNIEANEMSWQKDLDEYDRLERETEEAIKKLNK